MTKSSIDFTVNELYAICEDAREQLYEKYDPWASRSLDLAECLLEQLLLTNYVQEEDDEILLSNSDLIALIDGEDDV